MPPGKKQQEQINKEPRQRNSAGLIEPSMAPPREGSSSRAIDDTRVRTFTREGLRLLSPRDLGIPLATSNLRNSHTCCSVLGPLLTGCQISKNSGTPKKVEASRKECEEKLKRPGSSARKKLKLSGAHLEAPELILDPILGSGAHS